MSKKSIKKFTRNHFLQALIVVLLGSTYAYAATPTVNLGAADNFAILAGSTITNTGSSVINGDLGLSPGTVVSGFPPATLNGTQYIASPQAVSAQTALTSAFTDAAGRTPVSTIPTELGGTIIAPGVYDSAAGTFGITGTLTLDAKGDANSFFIFKTASTLTTAAGSNIVLIGGAQACNIFWEVGSSATLGTNSNIKGNIMALSSITLTTGSNVVGRVQARNGAVTLDSSTVSKAVCATPVAPAPTTTPIVAPVPTVFPTSTPVVAIAPAATTSVAAATIPVQTPVVIIPKLPSTGIGPSDDNTPWNIIVTVSIISLLFLLYAARRKQTN